MTPWIGGLKLVVRGVFPFLNIQRLPDRTGQYLVVRTVLTPTFLNQWSWANMSTFRRKSSFKTADLLAGTRTSSFSSSSFFTSSGIASLDDILGGGLPLSCSLLVIAPDTHSSYGELVLKYFISQGLVAGQKVYVVDEEPEQIVSKCMWPSNGAPSPAATPAATTAEENDEMDETDHEPKVTIAWRYEHLKQFQTTVSTSKS